MNQLWIIIFLIFIVLIILLAEAVVFQMGTSSEFKVPDLIVLLGSGDKVDSAMLNDRILKLVQASKDFPKTPILISGNENKKETSSVFNYIQKNAPDLTDKIYLHTTALRTLDSFEYIKSNYPNFKNLFIVTNAFHMRRSCALSNLLGLSSRGYAGDLNYRLNTKLFLRERVANILFLPDLLSHKYKQNVSK